MFLTFIWSRPTFLAGCPAYNIWSLGASIYVNILLFTLINQVLLGSIFRHASMMLFSAAATLDIFIYYLQSFQNILSTERPRASAQHCGTWYFRNKYICTLVHLGPSSSSIIPHLAATGSSWHIRKHNRHCKSNGVPSRPCQVRPAYDKWFSFLFRQQQLHEKGSKEEGREAVSTSVVSSDGRSGAQAEQQRQHLLLPREQPGDSLTSQHLLQTSEKWEQNLFQLKGNLCKSPERTARKMFSAETQPVVGVGGHNRGSEPRSLKTKKRTRKDCGCSVV